MFVESFNSGKLPPSLRNALTILILKPGKSATKCDSYRPISFINSDAKIIAKVWALRLERYQNGFVKGRQAFHCVCTVLNVIYLKTEHPGTAVLSLDAEKAFIRVEHRYLHKVLACLGFGNFFSNWINVLYNNSVASVLTNDIIFKPFNLSRGTHQGCTPSPLLFVIAIEPLAIAIRCNQNITDIKINEFGNKIGLFVDDIVVFLSQLEQSIHNLFNTISSFRKFSGYKINESRSAILFLKHSVRFYPPVQTPFKIVWDSFTYLAIRITPKIGDSVETNSFFQNVFTSFILCLLVLLFTFFQGWKACSVIHLEQQTG